MDIYIVLTSEELGYPIKKKIRSTSNESYGILFFICKTENYLTTTFLPLMMFTPFCGTRRGCPLVL